MQLDRQKSIELGFIQFLNQIKNQVQKPTPFFIEHAQELKHMFFDQLLSRALDYTARDLKKKNLAYYTISSAGHESNVLLGQHLKVTDPCFLHYRSGALMARRYRFDPERNYTKDVLMSLVCAQDEPVSGGRHKVWGSVKLNVLPQTSTIASHLPKAVGAAYALAKLKGQECLEGVNKESIVCCSFGDASANHSTALGAINTAKWTAYQKLPMPVLFVCEDNGLGISVKTPQHWIQNNFAETKSLKYFYADGNHIEDAYHQVKMAIDYCRNYKKPVFLHLKTTRLMGHAGSDIQAAYLSEQEILQQEKNDPILAWAQTLIEHDIVSKEEILQTYYQINQDITEKSKQCLSLKKIETSQTLANVYNHDLKTIDCKRLQLQENKKPTEVVLDKNNEKPRHMAMLISLGLKELMQKDASVMIFGEDVAKKGGVYHVTKGLYEQFGPARVFNTVLDEQSILGLAIGMSHMGFLPIPEIQYLAYYHNAEDQIRSEAGSTTFFSNGQFHNPMLIRIASFAYQKGFGGHFHNDNSIAALRDVPGVIIAAPSRGDDAVKMLRTCYHLAKHCGKVVFFLEPIALYMTKDLYEDQDEVWSFKYPKVNETIECGECSVHGKSKTVIISYANGYYMSLRAAKKLKEEQHKEVSVIDLRWLHPLPIEHLFKHLKRLQVEQILIVDECRKNGGVADSLSRAILEEFKTIQLKVIEAQESYIPLGPAANLVLPTEEDIVRELKKF
ncbi:MAG TPA: thiamine pyrophosphate-dependent enzyme [Oligoflexia bacterium]|nr:thiamine pyrophosphate-dependent enzyme [Oligoflexia bacterium]HMR24861.1 thiamine pyrophosphate-dependent enzyme [Oligoflexia bacterium]